ncbi:MAG: 50S ribosomal protein L17 [Planctomycetes bacterium]|nr:50S ribosomal protein L17 [Planctomycetota bacterium]
MRHRRAGKKLNRNATHRLALYRNLTKSLIQHERIITTLPKAKGVRPFVERLITLARRNTLHARRLVVARLGPMADAIVKPHEDDDGPADPRTVVQKLFSDIAPRYLDRPGGYTRIMKRHQVRLGDAGATAYLELLKAGEVRSRSKPAYTAPAPAPKVETQPAPPETPPTEHPAPEAPAQAQTPSGDANPPASA